MKFLLIIRLLQNKTILHQSLLYRRQNIPQLEGSSIEKALKGGNTVHEVADAHVIIDSTGSEVLIAINSSERSKESGINTRVVSLPDFHTFDRQPKEYQLSVLPDGIPILSVEVLSTSGWAKYAHEQIGIDRFGASDEAPDVYEFFNFTPEGTADRAVKAIDFYKGSKHFLIEVKNPFFC
ncbi:Transketolase 1 [Wickerhamomyces ciferrii]|uniref:Transketolase 1 n=1 Tax=Wickerhamomyces ciferrii (strain ATCC 14091 / BCRC 22168 / CBS 111 / JCM 3599 / NBRC 0793 / NRRL Y-1031 F-60-10) TaxID=1206466 RepID=K0KAR2_WICCF|nr:Transketolase 1 [Wickerhamomyces ciferrii]CCH42085.1 Transketolase 1 [Wickerhamomyces ciferrii]